MRYENDNGEIAVLITPSFGTGWSSSNPGCADWILFDPAIVEIVLEFQKIEDKSEMEKQIKQIIALRSYEYICDFGIKNLSVRWVPKGKPFRIHEYDGYETIVFVEDEKLYVG